MGKLGDNLRKTAYYFKRNGLEKTLSAVRERLAASSTLSRVERYSYRQPSEEELKQQRAESEKLHTLVSILVPAYNTPEEYMRRMIESCLNQSYERWELVIADASNTDQVESVVRLFDDPRIHFHRLEANNGISANSNEGLKYVSGSFTALLDHDDVLTPDALFRMVSAVTEDTLLVYSDEDKCNGDETEYYEPHYKEELNLDLILSNNYICHFTMIRTELIKELDFRPEYDGAQDYDLFLRVISRAQENLQKELRKENTPDRITDVIKHVPEILYHWRCHSGSTAANPASKEYAYEAGRRALQAYADREGWNATAVNTPHMGFYRLVFGPFVEDIFLQRPEVGLLGGKVTEAGKICGGRMDLEGNVFYEGTHSRFSGYMHRVSLRQSAEAVDVRCMYVNPRWSSMLEEAFGLTIDAKTGFIDIEKLEPDTDTKALSLKLCEKIREQGAEIVWDPQVEVKIV